MVNFDEYKEIPPVRPVRKWEPRSIVYGLRTLSSEDGETFYETREIRQPRSTPDDIFHTIQSGELDARFDLLSMNFYGTLLMWWIFPDVNDIWDLFDWTGAGKTIKVPSLPGIYNGMIKA